MGGYKTCKICEEEKKEKYFHPGRRQCIPCYNARRKEVSVNNGNVYERVIRLDARFDQMDKRMELLDDKIQTIMDLVNKMIIRDTNRNGGVFDVDETGYVRK